MLCCGRTDIGLKRKFNQDTFICETFDNGMMLCVVCDGMGGAAGGGIASGLACGYFVDSMAEFAAKFGKRDSINRTDERRIKAALADSCEKANSAVFERSREDKSLLGMGTTLVATLAYSDTLFTVNIGDSRMYLIHDDDITQISHDHSYVQYLVDNGKLSPSEAKNAPNRNIITRAVGTDTTVEPDIFVTHIHKNTDALEYVGVLCSDGLTNHVSIERIAATAGAALLVDSDRSLGHICEELIDLANEGGGNDNITAVIFAL